MDRRLKSLLIFVVLLIALNFLFKEVHFGIHISIVGSVILTLVISALMTRGSGSKGG